MVDVETTFPVLNGLPLNGIDPVTGAEFVLEDFEGWEGSTGSTLRVVPKARAGGAWAGKAYQRERNMVMGGKIFAASYAAITEAQTRLNTALTLDESRLDVDEAGLVRWCMVRQDDVPIQRRIAPTVSQWSVQVLAEDSRKFGAPLSASTRLPASSGGFTYPLTYPYTIDATMVSGQVSLNNPGNETGSVILRVDGPCHGPSITHVASGLTLVFSSSLVLGVGEWLTIDTEARTVMANDQSSRSGYITSRGWFGFVPGDNTFAFTASAFDADALLTVTATPAFK